MAINAQHFLGAADLHKILGQVACAQIDAINVVRPAQELIVLARGGSVDDADLMRVGGDSLGTFEYQAHALCLVPLPSWPALGVRRRTYRRRGWRGPQVDPAACDDVRRKLADQGPLTLRQLGGTQGSGWNRDSAARWAAEWLQAIGDVVVLRRSGTQRVFTLTEQALPEGLLDAEPDDQQCILDLAMLSLRCLGVGTTDDVADYFRLPARDVAAALKDSGAEAVAVEGWPGPAWLHPEADPAPSAVQSLPLSPFDPLVWYRPRQQRLFGRDWRLEAYKSPAKRTFGYYAMPILHGEQLAGRVAASRHEQTLRIEALEWDPGAGDAALATTLERLAAWTRTTALSSDSPLPGLLPELHQAAVAGGNQL